MSDTAPPASPPGGAPPRRANHWNCLNVVMLMGRLGLPPEVTYTDTGKTRGTFVLITEEASGKRNWHRIVVWGRLGEIAARRLHQGDRVFVTGRIDYYIRELPGTGKTVVNTQIVANRVQFLNWGAWRENHEPGVEEWADLMETVGLTG